jgi:hypothetical protein
LELTSDGLLVQIAPSFGGNMLAEIVTEKHRPQMATVRPGTFREIPHNSERTAAVERLPLPAQLPSARVRQVEYERAVQREHAIENANVIVCGGRGLGNKNNFRKLDELAKLLGGDVGATRPVVYAGWAGHDVLIGQAGKHIKPKILFSFGISGAIQQRRVWGRRFHRCRQQESAGHHDENGRRCGRGRRGGLAQSPCQGAAPAHPRINRHRPAGRCFSVSGLISGKTPLRTERTSSIVKNASGLQARTR